MVSRRLFVQSSAASAAYVASGLWPAWAANAPGVTDTEIKIGQTMPYSGPASSYGLIGRAEAAYFKMVNDTGGVNGRKINLISLDDGYSPPKTVEQTRRLVEQEQVGFSQHVRRSTALSLDDNLRPNPSVGGTSVRQVHRKDDARREDRGPLSER